MSQTLQRAITILEMVAERPRRIGDIAAALEVHHSTALRLLHTLRDNRLVFEQADHAYRLGSGVFALANRALEQIDLRDVAKPFMRSLSEATSETVHLGVIEGGSVVYLDKVEASHPVRMYSRIGATAPLHCTGVAKAIIAFQDTVTLESILGSVDFTRHTAHTIVDLEDFRAELRTVREHGYAFDREEHEVGIHCVAAPIHAADGEVRAALSLSMPTSRVPQEELETFTDRLVAATAGISNALGWQDG
jgi:IclR family transcriptional regulator, KDG regulon repressor